jgi:hypothetical protein
MDKRGLWPRAAMSAGLLAFVVLLLIPGLATAGLFVLLLSPVAAAVATGIELIVSRDIWPGVSLLTAVAFIAGVVSWSLF